jgi:hypothetical protein
MANEIELGVSFSYAKNDAEFELVLSGLLATVTGNACIRHVQSIGTTEEALDLGGLAAPLGWSAFRNLDPTNYLEVRSGTGAGNDIIKIPPLKFAVFHWGSDVTAPFAIANTAACLLDYFIAEQ